MTQYIYINHRVKQKNPRKPVIVCQSADGTIREANEFQIRVGGKVIGHVVYDRDGLPECDTHDVKAWVEFYGDCVDIVPEAVVAPGRPPTPFSVPLVATAPREEFKPAAASAKRPNQPVEIVTD